MALNLSLHSSRHFLPTILSAPIRRSFALKSVDLSHFLLNYPGPSKLYQHQPSGLVSFLSAPPASPSSPTILGSLSQTGTFTQNPAFLTLLHSVFSASYLNDPHVLDLSSTKKSLPADSYVHVLDQRIGNSYNDREPTSIIFSFLVNSKSGLPVPNTYEANPAFRIHTPLEGFFVLPPSLHKTLLRGCGIARKIEEETYR
ncbi:hypothetical protein O181_073757 [Austropuccinia psidii MF-1]|uniref:Uncharacterized protein n=1 Tax=Austropuccinia psidii MF-1 TaxID=1389203 RepID=A0A9Q3IBC4_9BASI|nr:hypothetical protein [Austropuccinia psidii MF-1]